MTGKKMGITYRGVLMFFLCCMMLLSGSAMESRAEIYEGADGVKYSFFYSTNGGTRVVITNVYVPTAIKSVTVPAKINGHPVVAIGADSAQNFTGAFSKNSQLLSVTLPDSVCEIYERAFEGLTNLQAISLNGDGIVIGYKAFKGCNKLKVTFRGTGAVKYISGYAFWTTDSNCLDYNVIKSRVDKDSWIGYDATWNNEADWKALVNSLTPFSISVKDDANQNWEPTFDELNAANGYSNPEQIVSAKTATSDYNAWIRKAAKWVDSDEERAEIRLDVAYNPMSVKSTNDMVFVLDVSGSMYFANNLIAGSNYSRQFQTLDQARSVGKALLDLNEGGTVYNRIGVTMFNAQLRGSTRSAAGATEGFFTDYASFIKWLDQENWIYNSATGYSFGLNEAAYIITNRADKSRTPSVVFLSDGVPNTGDKGTFPGTSISGYGGTATAGLSVLGVTRYSILLGDKSDSALKAVTLVAGAPGTSNDSTKTYASPDAATLQQAFQTILMQMTENLSLFLSDTAGEYFDVNATPTATGGSVSLSGTSTSWDFSGTSPRQVYTLIIIQELKRNSNDNNAFFYGDMKTNLGEAVLDDAAIGRILGVGSPGLSKAYEEVTITVIVIEGLATGKDGRKREEISDTITKTGTYKARYEGHPDAFLESITVSADGGTPVAVSTESHSSEYEIKDARCDYVIIVTYRYPEAEDGTWSYYAFAIGGTIEPLAEKGISTDEYRSVEYSPDDGYKLDYILVGIQDQFERKLSESELELYKKAYQFPKANSGEVHTIKVVYSEIPEGNVPTTETWGDYRR